MNITIKLLKIVILMANEKKKIRIVGIILLVIGLFTIITYGIGTYINWEYTGPYYFLFEIIVGVFLFALGLVFLLLSRKKILAANATKIAKTIVHYIFLVIGFTMIIYSVYGLSISGTYGYWFVGPFIMGVLLFVIGLVLRIRSGKENEHKREKIVILTATEKKKKRRRTAGIGLVVIGSLISVFFGVYGYLVSLQSAGWGAIFINPTIVGVIIIVIGICLLVLSFSESQGKPSKPSKPSRWKQVKPIT